jgi:hypothetical protein
MNEESSRDEPDDLPLKDLGVIARDVALLCDQVGTDSTIGFLIGLAEGTILTTAKSSDYAVISLKLTEIMLLLEKSSAFATGQREH